MMVRCFVCQACKLSLQMQGWSQMDIRIEMDRAVHYLASLERGGEEWMEVSFPYMPGWCDTQIEPYLDPSTRDALIQKEIEELERARKRRERERQDREHRKPARELARIEELERAERQKERDKRGRERAHLLLQELDELEERARKCRGSSSS